MTVVYSLFWTAVGLNLAVRLFGFVAQARLSYYNRKLDALRAELDADCPWCSGEAEDDERPHYQGLPRIYNMELSDRSVSLTVDFAGIDCVPVIASLN